MTESCGNRHTVIRTCSTARVLETNLGANSEDHMPQVLNLNSKTRISTGANKLLPRYYRSTYVCSATDDAPLGIGQCTTGAAVARRFRFIRNLIAQLCRLVCLILCENIAEMPSITSITALIFAYLSSEIGKIHWMNFECCFLQQPRTK